MIIAGPCSVESRSQLLETAIAVREAGAHALRGGVFKPRTSPYSFPGLGEDGIELLVEARQLTGLPIVTEVMREEQIPILTRYVDVLQVGRVICRTLPCCTRLAKASIRCCSSAA